LSQDAITAPIKFQFFPAMLIPISNFGLYDIVERENPEHFRFHFRASPVILAIGSNYSQGARVKGTTDLLLI
jgi:hypothetical protein